MLCPISGVHYFLQHIYLFLKFNHYRKEKGIEWLEIQERVRVAFLLSFYCVSDNQFSVSTSITLIQTKCCVKLYFFPGQIESVEHSVTTLEVKVGIALIDAAVDLEVVLLLSLCFSSSEIVCFRQTSVWFFEAPPMETDQVLSSSRSTEILEINEKRLRWKWNRQKGERNGRAKRGAIISGTHATRSPFSQDRSSELSRSRRSLSPSFSGRNSGTIVNDLPMCRIRSGAPWTTSRRSGPLAKWRTGEKTKKISEKTRYRKWRRRCSSDGHKPRPDNDRRSEKKRKRKTAATATESCAFTDIVSSSIKRTELKRRRLLLRNQRIL